MLYSSEDDLIKLRKLFVGKKVVAVEPPGADEAIAKFVMDDGTAFRLHATELGYWTEPTIARAGCHYQHLEPLFTDYCNHEYKLRLPEPAAPVVSVNDGVLRVQAPDGTAFEADASRFEEWERTMLQYPELIATAAPLGDLWRGALRNECPPELGHLRPRPV